MFLDNNESKIRNEDSTIDFVLIARDLSLIAFIVSWYIFAPKVVVIILLLLHILLIPYNKKLSIAENIEKYKMYEFWIARMCVITIPFILVSFSYQLREVAWVLILALLVERCYIFYGLKTAKGFSLQFKHLFRGGILVLVAAATVYFYPYYRANLVTGMEDGTVYYLGLNHKLQIGAIMIIFLVVIALLGQCMERIIIRKERTHEEKLAVYDFWVSYPVSCVVVVLELMLYSNA